MKLTIWLVVLMCVACDVDGLCAPPPCGADIGCPEGQVCLREHGTCLTPCDIAGGCPGAAECRTDGEWTFCADADGLPVVACPEDPQ
jgi:hypothetical protein